MTEWIARSFDIQEVPGSGPAWPQLTLSYGQATLSASNGVSTMALKPMGPESTKVQNRVPVAPQNGGIVTENYFLKKQQKNIGISRCSVVPR